MTIYIDIIFLENLIMNSIILYATGLILKTKINFLRIFIASLFGTIYVIAQYISNLNIYANIITKTILSFVMVYISFNPKNIKQLIKQFILFYLTTFTFGGVATYLIYVLKPQDIIMKNGLFVGTYVLKVIFIGAILGTIVLIVAFRLARNKLTQKDMICQIKVGWNKKEQILNAMIDTGNMLKEPISGMPVVVIEKNSLYEMLPKEILNNIDNILEGKLDNIPNEIQEQYISRLKIIPFSSLGKENGMLIGIKPDKFQMIKENIISDKNVIVGIYNKSLTTRGEYTALIGIELC